MKEFQCLCIHCGSRPHIRREFKSRNHGDPSRNNIPPSEYQGISFWEAEAREWERLYKEQRGGPAFDSLQQKYAELLMRYRKLENEHHRLYDETESLRVKVFTLKQSQS